MTLRARRQDSGLWGALRALQLVRASRLLRQVIRPSGVSGIEGGNGHAASFSIRAGGALAQAQ
jgi:hypothetical protein